MNEEYVYISTYNYESKNTSYLFSEIENYLATKDNNELALNLTNLSISMFDIFEKQYYNDSKYMGSLNTVQSKMQT